MAGIECIIVPSFEGNMNYFQINTNIKYFDTKTFFIDNCQKIKLLVAQKIYSFIIKENIIKLINLSWLLL